MIRFSLKTKPLPAFLKSLPSGAPGSVFETWSWGFYAWRVADRLAGGKALGRRTLWVFLGLLFCVNESIAINRSPRVATNRSHTAL